MTETLLFDYWRSSAAYRVRIGLALLGLAYESVDVDLSAGAQRGTENLSRNPQGLVPTFHIDGISLTQSLSILEYLDETRSAGWLPGGPAERARVRALAYAVAMDIHPVCNLRVAQHAVTLGATMEGWMSHFITLGFEGLEAMLRGSPGRLSHGDTVTLADICLVPQVYNARRWGVGLGPFPRIAAVAEALEEMPAFIAAHPDRARPSASGPSTPATT